MTASVSSTTSQDAAGPLLPAAGLAPTAVYWFFNRHGRLIYVGIAEAPKTRWRQHEKTAPWWPEVDHTRTLLRWFNTREQAHVVEVQVIRTEHPLYNVRHALDNSQQDLLVDAVRLADQQRRVESDKWTALLRARLAGIPDEVLCDEAGESRATLNRRYGPRKAMAVKWDGTNFDDVKLIRPDARLTEAGDLEIERVDQPGTYVVVGINYVVRRQEDAP